MADEFGVAVVITNQVRRFPSMNTDHISQCASFLR